MIIKAEQNLSCNEMYIISLFLNLLQMKQEAKEINLLIRNRNKDQD